MQLIIRETRKEDLSALATIYTSVYNGLNIGENWTDEKAKVLLQDFLDQQADLFFTAIDGDKVVGGIVALVKPWWDGNHLTDGEIFVDSNYQKQGVGRRLIKKLFEKGLGKYQAVSWDTFTHRVYEHPLKWYKSIGFEEIKQWVMITGDIKEVLKRLK